MWVRAWAGPGRDMGGRREGECGRVYGQREGSRKGGGDAKGGYIPRIVTAVQTWIETDKTPDPPPSQIEIRRQQPPRVPRTRIVGLAGGSTSAPSIPEGRVHGKRGDRRARGRVGKEKGVAEGSRKAGEN